jgi:hypothetical protein
MIFGRLIVGLAGLLLLGFAFALARAALEEARRGWPSFDPRNWR